MPKIPNITKNLLVINILAYLAMWLLRTTTANSAMPIDLNDILGLHFFMASDFHVYQLITYMFMHGGLMHLLFNMFALWMFGCVVENTLGPKRFLFFYIICGVGAGLFQEVAQFTDYAIEGLAAYDYVNMEGLRVSMDEYLNAWSTVGASGAVYAILLAFGMLFPEQHLFIFPLPMPIKAKWLVVIYAVIELFSAISTTNDGVAHIAHLGGMVFGFFLIRYWKNRPYGGYGRSNGNDLFSNLRNRWKNNTTTTSNTGQNPYYGSTSRTSDWNYNAQKTATQKEIDAILDKIRKSGYDSLTKAEKQKLFDQNKK